MDTNQLLGALDRDSCAHSLRAYGVYPINAIVPHTPKSAYIFNTHPHWRGGQHWVALFISGWGFMEYFDSYGNPPPPQLRLGTSYTWNKVRLQGPLDIICGLYCLYFIHNRCVGRPIRDIISSLPAGDHKHFLYNWFLDTYSRKNV